MTSETRSSAWVAYFAENFDLVLALLGLALATILSSLGVMPASAVLPALLVIGSLFITYQIRTSKDTWESMKRIESKLVRSERLAQRTVDYIANRTAGEVRRISGEARLYAALTDCANNPDTGEVLATYFSPSPPDLADERVSAYWQLLLGRVREGDFSVRRIVTIENAAKLRWIRGLLDETREVPNLCIAALDHGNPHGDLLNLIVFDKREVFLFGPHRHDGGTRDYIGLLNADAGAVFHDYFDSVWQRLTAQDRILKNGTTMPRNDSLLEELGQRFAEGRDF